MLKLSALVRSRPHDRCWRTDGDRRKRLAGAIDRIILELEKEHEIVKARASELQAALAFLFDDEDAPCRGSRLARMEPDLEFSIARCRELQAQLEDLRAVKSAAVECFRQRHDGAPKPTARTGDGSELSRALPSKRAPSNG